MTRTWRRMAGAWRSLRERSLAGFLLAPRGWSVFLLVTVALGSFSVVFLAGWLGASKPTEMAVVPTGILFLGCVLVRLINLLGWEQDGLTGDPRVVAGWLVPEKVMRRGNGREMLERWRRIAARRTGRPLSPQHPPKVPLTADWTLWGSVARDLTDPSAADRDMAFDAYVRAMEASGGVEPPPVQQERQQEPEEPRERQQPRLRTFTHPPANGVQDEVREALERHRSGAYAELVSVGLVTVTGSSGGRYTIGSGSPDRPANPTVRDHGRGVGLCVAPVQQAEARPWEDSWLTLLNWIIVDEPRFLREANVLPVAAVEAGREAAAARRLRGADNPAEARRPPILPPAENPRAAVAFVQDSTLRPWDDHTERRREIARDRAVEWWRAQHGNAPVAVSQVWQSSWSLVGDNPPHYSTYIGADDALLLYGLWLVRESTPHVQSVSVASGYTELINVELERLYLPGMPAGADFGQPVLVPGGSPLFAITLNTGRELYDIYGQTLLRFDAERIGPLGRRVAQNAPPAGLLFRGD